MVNTYKKLRNKCLYFRSDEIFSGYVRELLKLKVSKCCL